VSLPAPKDLVALDVLACQHCNIRSNANVFCEIWVVWTCIDCMRSVHRVEHTICIGKAEKNAEKDESPKYFTLWVTRYDGRKLPMSLRLGDKLEIENHWLGTYIFGGGGMILVTEDRATINERILLGLKGLQ